MIFYGHFHNLHYSKDIFADLCSQTQKVPEKRYSVDLILVKLKGVSQSPGGLIYNTVIQFSRTNP